mmetsp:Transcript_30862/g.77133  ORF Transcript_30862/g.77133 Transcript_30862/m.77133 type:complete len:194 (+) Transcript_30862:616-1197(+)
MLPVVYTFPFGYLLIQVGNIFLSKLLHEMTLRKLAKEEIAAYNAPFPTIKSRKPVAQFPLEVPFDGKPVKNHSTVAGYSEWLKVTQMPKLFLKFSPGVLINKDMAAWIEKSLPNITTVDCGAGKHFVQEDAPDLIGQKIVAWMSTQLSSQSEPSSRRIDMYKTRLWEAHGLHVACPDLDLVSATESQPSHAIL